MTIFKGHLTEVGIVLIFNFIFMSNVCKVLHIYNAYKIKWCLLI